MANVNNQAPKFNSSDKTPIVYVVEERNRLGGIRSRLQTKDGFYAMSDWLLRIHRPIGFPPGSRVGDGTLHFRSTGLCMPIPSQHALAKLLGEFSYNSQVVRQVTLTTHLSSLEFDMGYHRDSGELYRSPEYGAAVRKLSERMSRWCEGYLDIGYVMAQFAAQDTQHDFWVSRVMGRGRGLGY